MVNVNGIGPFFRPERSVLSAQVGVGGANGGLGTGRRKSPGLKGRFTASNEPALQAERN